MSNGVLDLNDFPYVVHIGLPQGGFCSGILVTPGYVLTARHCVAGHKNGCFYEAHGESDNTKGDYVVVFDAPNGTFGANHAYTITTVDDRTYHYPAVVTSHDPIDSCSKADSSEDLALLRLDARVPVSSVRPMHVPLLGYPACNSILDVEHGFGGTLVGYGDTDFIHGDSGQRSTATDPLPDGYPYSLHRWVRETTWPDPVLTEKCSVGILDPDCLQLCTVNVLDPKVLDCPKALPGATYDYYVEATPTWWMTYYGNLFGDSGGPLLSSDKYFVIDEPNSEMLGNPQGRLLCGVCSRYYAAQSGDHFQVLNEVGSEYVALDSPLAHDFLQAELVASDGNFKGECFSGNNAVLRDQDADDDLIPDACDPCPHYYDANYDLSTLPDSDVDGVPDRCDNCATVKNEIQETGNWRGQPDADGDGYGDACDSCPDTNGIVAAQGHTATDYQCCTKDSDCNPGQCKTYEIVGDDWQEVQIQRCIPGDSRGRILADQNLGMACLSHCSVPVDHDCDTKGDVCDNCPGIPNEPQADTDGDGPGDACDNCPGSLDGITHAEDVNPECTFLDPVNGDAFCKTLNPFSLCIPGNTKKAPPADKSRCSRFEDSEEDYGDGVGLACDNCPHVRNGLQLNCNSDIEIARGMSYPYVGDACDPNPCADMTHSYQPQYKSKYGSIEELWYRPLFLPQGHPVWGYSHHFNYLPSTDIYSGPRATVGLRFCGCDTGAPNPSADECAKQAQCTLDSGQYSPPPGTGTNWNVPSLAQAISNSNVFQPSAEYADLKPIDPVPSETEGQLPDFASIYSGGTRSTHWYVGTDSTAFGNNDGTLTGLLWSHVPLVTRLLPTPGAAAVLFGPHSNHYLWGEFGARVASSIQAPIGPFPTIPIIITEPGKPPWGHLGKYPDAANLIVDQASVMVQARGATWAEDLTALMSRSAISALYSPGVRWVAPAEAEQWTGSHPVVMASVALNRVDVKSVLAPTGRTFTDVLSQCTSDACVPSVARLASSASPLGARGRYGLVLSRREGSLFVIGGVMEPDQSVAGNVLRFDLNDRRWVSYRIGGAGVGPVLAATYRPHDRLLYVVDEVRIGAAKFARLLAIDSATRRSKSLGLWPRKNVDRVFITNTHRATLLLVGSGSKAFKGVELTVTEAGTVQARQGFLGKGRVAADPHLTTHGLTLPLEDRVQAIRNEFVPLDEMDTKLVVVHPGECF